MTSRERRKLLTGLAFISPWIVGFVALTLYPVVAALYLSFCDYDVLTSPVWVGTLNYRDMATDGVFWKSLANTLVYAAFSLPLGMALALVVAVLLQGVTRFRGVLRTAFFLPSMVPLIAVAMVWLWLFNGRFGLLNYALSLVGVTGPSWLTDPNWTKPALVIASLWQVGGTIVIYLAALQDVPRHLYESASLDGAGPWTKFRHITVPIISPVIYFNLVMGIINCMQVFVTPFVMMPNGGPNRSALFYAVYLYQNAFSYNQMGYASAMAVVLFAVIVTLTWVATRATRRHIYYAGE